MTKRILFSNVGYAKGIDGSLKQHVMRATRHVSCPVPVQHQVLGQLKQIITLAQPDICCFVEIDSGSFSSRGLNHLTYLSDEHYPFVELAGKYGEELRLARLPLLDGKSNGFIARKPYAFERVYMTTGFKRLVYHLHLPDNTHLFFGHFSLQKHVRRLQFQQMNERIRDCLDTGAADIIVLADFNVMQGFAELAPLTEGLPLQIMSDADLPTFTFLKRRLALDLCLCTPGIAQRAQLEIIPQPFSDHAALLLTLADVGEAVH